MNLYVVYDKLAEESGPIFEAKNHQVARRKHEQLMERTGRPDEYQLLYLGCINHADQTMELCQLPEDVTGGTPAMAVQGGGK